MAEEQMECMCLECGISNFVDIGKLALEDTGVGQPQIVRNTYCAECGGTLTVIGKAGDEPNYKLKA